MQSHYNNQHLPIPADQVFQQNIVDQIPAPPRVNTGGVDAQTATDIHCGLINIIQCSINKGPIRIFMFNMMSDNRFNNQAYIDLYTSTIDYYCYLYQMNDRNALNNAIEQSVLAEIANIVERYPALQNYITQDQIPFINDYIRIRNEIVNVMRQFSSQGVPQGNYPQIHNAPSRIGSPMGFNGGNQHQMGMGQRLTSPIQSSPTFRGPSGGGRSPMVSHQSMLATPQSQLRSTPGRVGSKPTVGRLPQNETTRLAVNNNKADGDMIRIEDEDRDLAHHISMDDDIPAYPAAIDRVIEFSDLNYPLAFRTDQRLVINIEDAIKKYGICTNKETDVDYADHELDYNLIRLSKSNTHGPVVETKSNWAEVTAPNRVDDNDIDNPSDDEDVSPIGDHEPIILNKFVEAYSLSQAHVEAVNQLSSIKLNPTSDRLFEYYVDLKTPMICSESDIALIQDVLLESTDLTDLIDKFSELAGDDPETSLSPRVWYQIHDRLTNVMNRRLNAGINSGIEGIDTITGDYEDAMTAIGEDFTNTAIDRFKRNTFVSMLKAIRLSFNEGETAFVESQSVTQLPWLSSEIDLLLKEKYSMLSKSVSKDMFTAVLRVFNRTNTNEISVNRRFLITLDNVWIEIHHGDIGKDTILISKVECKS